MAQQQEKHFHMQMFINKTLDFKTSNVLFSFYNYTILTQNKPTELQQQQQHTYILHTYVHQNYNNRHNIQNLVKKN